MTATGPYQPNAASLNSHMVPQWFSDAKLGIFIHWGLFSVPGFAPNGIFSDVLRNDYDRALIDTPYAEDYWNAMKDPSTATARHHKQTYGDMPYEGFKEQFEARLKDWNADAWAQIFQDTGARYIVITAKHGDGFCLWPTDINNPHQADWHTQRDIVGELATAVRKRGMRFGAYYSGGVDWTFQRKIVRTIADYSYLAHGDDYADYADAQVRELIARYKPDIIWNDISWPTDQKRAFGLFADYYNSVPDGAINDRWTTASYKNKLFGTWIGRKVIDTVTKLAIRHDPKIIENIKPPVVPHSDFTTPEYAQYDTIQSKKWEMTRGIGNSFGYNQNETDREYASFENTLFPSFIDAVSKNGNLLLNVGPNGGAGIIPDLQKQRLDNFGEWLAQNGSAVYGTKPWKQAEATFENGQGAHFTAKGDKLYLLLDGQIRQQEMRLRNVKIEGSTRILGSEITVTTRSDGVDTVFEFAEPLDSFGPALEITPNSITGRGRG